jgi:NAD-dependent DNA ligase
MVQKSGHPRKPPNKERVRPKKKRTVPAKNSKRVKSELKQRLDVSTNEPRSLPLDGAVYAFTGVCDYGKQEECGEAMEELGAKYSPRMTRKVDVLVIGAKGSATFKWSKYGNKIKDAADWRSESKKPLIVMERYWFRKLELK